MGLLDLENIVTVGFPWRSSCWESGIPLGQGGEGGGSMGWFSRQGEGKKSSIFMKKSNLSFGVKQIWVCIISQEITN